METSDGTSAAPDGGLAALHAAETALQLAQLRSDVEALDVLVHDDALFVAPDGSVLDKAADLHAHRSGQLRLDEVLERSRTARLVGDAAGATCVRLHLRGTAGGDAVEADLTYTRTWLLDSGAWRVVQAQGCFATVGG